MSVQQLSKPCIDPASLAPLIDTLSAYHPLSDELKYEFLGRLKTFQVPQNDYLVKQGHFCDYFYFLIKGILVSTTNRNNKELTTFIIGDGTFVTSITGMYGVCPSDDSIYAVEDCLLVGLHTDDINYLYDHFPEMNTVMRLIMEDYFRGSHERSIMTRLGTAKEKYLHLIDYLKEHLHRIPLVHKASYLDIRPETLLRIKKEIDTENNNELWTALHHRITQHNIEQEDFRLKTITIGQFAKNIDIPVHQLNFVLKNKYKKSFTQYINSLRINFAKEKLAKTSEWKHLTIEAVGIDAGFKSRSVFFSEFRKQTGLSPGEYLRRLETSPEFGSETRSSLKKQTKSK